MLISMKPVSDIGTIDRIFSPHEDNYFRDYLKDRYERTMDYLEKAGTGAARGFMERSRKIFDTYNSSDALRKTRATIRSALGIKKSNSIFSAADLPTLRSAGYAMQRFLMADPILRDKYHKQRIDGYSDTYFDTTPEDVGLDHYDYRRVVNGVWMPERSQEGEDLLVHRTFYEKLHEGDRELDPEEQSDLLDSWDIQRMFLEAGYDPTSRLGGMVG